MFDSYLSEVVVFGGFIVPFLAIPLAVSLIDFITQARASQKKPLRVDHNTSQDDDFTILVPIFRDIKYLRNTSFLAPYGSKVVLCTTTKETACFNDQLNSVARQHDFRIFRSDVPFASSHQKTNPWKIFHKTLAEAANQQILTDAARDEIIRDSFAVVHSTYIVFLDGDTVAEDALDGLVGVMKTEGYDLASVRVLASKSNTLIERLQGVEYELAMDARRIYPWLTSGACMVARTDTMKDVMSHHSLFFSGGDIEIGKLAGMLKYRVGHIAFNFYTDVPDTFKGWFKQRMAWCGGGFRHAIINCNKFTWRYPFFYLYTTVIVYGLTPLRWYELWQHPWVLPAVIVFYWVLLFLFHWKQRRWFYLLFPFYSLIQVMVIVPLGLYSYIRMVWESRNIGFIRLRENVQSSSGGYLPAWYHVSRISVDKTVPD